MILLLAPSTNNTNTGPHDKNRLGRPSVEIEIIIKKEQTVS